MNHLSVYLIEDSERHWVCAANQADALAVYCEIYSGLPESEYEIKKLDPCEVLRVKEDGGEATSKTCAEWTKEGRGFIGSTVF